MYKRYARYQTGCLYEFDIPGISDRQGRTEMLEKSPSSTKISNEKLRNA